VCVSTPKSKSLARSLSRKTTRQQTALLLYVCVHCDWLHAVSLICFLLSLSLSPNLCVCVCVCKCLTDSESERAREKQKGIYFCAAAAAAAAVVCWRREEFFETSSLCFFSSLSLARSLSFRDGKITLLARSFSLSLCVFASFFRVPPL
jgi:hypothetical protein